jgi:hypothetical protein
LFSTSVVASVFSSWSSPCWWIRLCCFTLFLHQKLCFFLNQYMLAIVEACRKKICATFLKRDLSYYLKPFTSRIKEGSSPKHFRGKVNQPSTAHSVFPYQHDYASATALTYFVSSTKATRFGEANPLSLSPHSLRHQL